MLRLKNILHPTDFSAPSRQAFQLAWSLARDHGAKLLLVHIAPPLVTYGEFGGVAHTEIELDKLRQDLKQIRGPDESVQVERCLEEGEPASLIIRLADKNQSDLIVMATHGRTGLGRWLMGSVAEQVMRRASCPVLTVKNNQKAVPAETAAAEPAVALGQTS